jgi:hypothetical protein
VPSKPRIFNISSYLIAALYRKILINVQLAMLCTEREVEVDDCYLGYDDPDREKEVDALNQLRSVTTSKKPSHFTYIKWDLG